MRRTPPLQSVAFIIMALVALATLPLVILIWFYTDSGAVRFLAAAWAFFLASCGAAYGYFVIDGSFERIKRFARNIRSGKFEDRLYPSRVPQLSLLYRDLNQMASATQRKVSNLADLSAEQDAILGTMLEGVLAIDPEGRVHRINAAARRLLDITTLVVEGRLVEEVIHRADIQRCIREALKRGEGYTSTVSVTGEVPRVLELHASGLVGGGRFSPGMMVVIHDITRVERLETVRRDFVANVSHELRTPITSIMGFVETLLEGAMKEPESLERFLKIIGRQAERLHFIFNDLLTLAKLEASGEGAIIELERKRACDLARAAVDDCTHRASEKGMTLVVDVSPDSFVLVNQSMIEQALANLIDNAIKYSEPDREIRVEARVVEDLTELRVVDRGPGIDKEHVPRLFERFYRVDRGRSRQVGGTGLGLAIVKHIAQVHGGRVGLESVLGEGSVFSIFVKSAPDSAAL